MNLRTLKLSLLELNQSEAMKLILAIRTNRRISKQKVAGKPKKSKASKIVKSLDPSDIPALLDLLERGG